MFKNMLVLLDGSNLAEVVFSYAQELAGRLNINLELLHVCSPQEADQLPMRKAYMEHMAEVLQKKAEEIRCQTGNTSKDQCIQVKGSVVVGYPADEIIKYIEANKIDLVMLSTHGRSGIGMWDLGNIANKVIHAVNVPVWVVPSELREEVILDKVPKRTMVIPLDGSKLSEGVIPAAISLARQRGSVGELVLVWVYNPSVNPVNIEQLKEQETRRKDMEKYLADKVKMIQDGGIQARYEVLLGEPARTIIDFVKNNPTQLIAMATRAHTGLSKMIFGSVTENVIHLVKKTPIFLVKTQE
jgi:nucleotide-binding universal stress UspA family protein